ncbi:MAG TPA: glycosyltransferase [Bacteroidetes bacterium]|nr:glycosyltransferase [Bacteroidota bacterium]
MNTLYFIYLFFSGVIIFFLLLPFVSVLVSFFKKEKIKSKEELKSYKEYDYGCIITAYKNVEITRGLIQSLLKQNYKQFHIYLVADECDISHFNLSDKQLTVLNPNPPLRLKAKSIIHAIENFIREHEYIAVFDGDNLAHPDFLKHINLYVNNGHQVVQGQRTAKNLDTLYACADATGEFYKNHTERYLPYLLGSSAVISGSGMAVEAQLYKAYLNGPEIQQGKEKWKKMLQEDKILQNDLVGKNEKISYAYDAIVFDEKVTTAEQVETQRSRWLFSYFQNLPNSSGMIWKGIKNFSFNQLFFGILTIAPPLFIMLFLAVALSVIGLFVNPLISLVLVISIVIFILNIFLVLYLAKAPTQVWKAIWGLPLFVWNQITALFKMGDPNKNFKHSEHTRNFTIDEVLSRSSHELPPKGNR